MPHDEKEENNNARKQIGCGDKNLTKICGGEWKKRVNGSEEEIVGDGRKLAMVSFVWL